MPNAMELSIRPLISLFITIFGLLLCPLAAANSSRPDETGAEKQNIVRDGSGILEQTPQNDKMLREMIARHDQELKSTAPCRHIAELIEGEKGIVSSGVAPPSAPSGSLQDRCSLIVQLPDDENRSWNSWPHRTVADKLKSEGWQHLPEMKTGGTDGATFRLQKGTVACDFKAIWSRRNVFPEDARSPQPLIYHMFVSCSPSAAPPQLIQQ